MTDIERLKGFVRDVFSKFPDNMPDEFDLQDLAIKYGILIETMAVRPCADICACDDYGTFPLTCLRRSHLLAEK